MSRLTNNDYTLSYLRYLAGFRATAPAARDYGLSPEEAQAKRNMVDSCFRRGLENHHGPHIP